MRLTVIRTGQGDGGWTTTGDGRRLPKHHLVFQVLGDLDELNAYLGILRSECLSGEIDRLVASLQQRLFDLGASVAVPERALSPGADLLQADIDRLGGSLPPLEEFILPGGCRAGACCHLARTVCRRAERQLTALAAEEPVHARAIPFLNSLSDLLFILARTINRDAGVTEAQWQPPPTKNT